MELLGQALLVVGVALVVVSAVAAAIVREPLPRLHLLAPVTTLGAPMIGIAVAVDSGASLSTAWIIAITAAIAGTGPVAQVAIAHAIAHRRGSGTSS